MLAVLKQHYRPILYSLLAVILVVSLLVVLTRGVRLVDTQVLASNDVKAQVAGIEKTLILPHPKGEIKPLGFSAAAVVALDVDSKTPLFVKNPDKQLPIASTTKIMTALVAAEHFDPNQILTVHQEALVNGSSMGLKLGEQLSFRSLLYGMLLNSGNDAAFAIADNYPGGLTGFIKSMNQKALSLGLKNTKFDNPAGFDSPNHYSSAFDLAKIALAAQDNQSLLRAVSTKEAVVASIDKSVIHPLKNLNKLLDEPGFIGFKTGYTEIAKENLVAEAERDNHKVLTVVLGSSDRFGESKALMDWSYENYRWE